MNWRLKHPTPVVLLLAGIVLVQIFHVLVLVGLIPYQIVGGGRIKSRQDMYQLESIALGINFLLIFILLIKGSFVREYLSVRQVNLLLNIFGFFFLLNTIGNLFSSSQVEQFVFAPLALIFAGLIFWVLRSNRKG
jgi:hypothetical protein